MRVNPSGCPHCASLIIGLSCIGSAKLINICMPPAPSMHRCMLPHRQTSWQTGTTHSRVYTKGSCWGQMFTVRVRCRFSQSCRCQTAKSSFNVDPRFTRRANYSSSLQLDVNSSQLHPLLKYQLY